MKGALSKTRGGRLFGLRTLLGRGSHPLLCFALMDTSNLAFQIIGQAIGARKGMEGTSKIPRS